MLPFHSALPHQSVGAASFAGVCSHEGLHAAAAHPAMMLGESCAGGKLLNMVHNKVILVALN